ncbi:MAG: thiamine-phosphate kinase [Bacteroidota bacterium]
MEQSQRTEINTLGEFGLIERLAQKVTHYHPETVKGIADDAAVMAIGDQWLVTSTDFLLEGVHFDLTYTPLKHLGYKAVAVNISDIAAMNAVPKQITVSIALSNRFSLDAVEELYEGIRFACQNYKVDLVGGDTTSSRTGLVISITALGLTNAQEITYRSTAQKGDILCCTGDLGAAYLGLQVLEREKQTYLANPNMQPELVGKDYLVGRQLKPEARMDIIHELQTLALKPTAMIDISDGLASEVLHVCKQSQLGAVVYEDKLPIEQVAYDTAINDFNIVPTVCALNGGEDYELLFTIRQEDYEKIKLHADITTVGYMTEKEKGVKLATRGGSLVPLEAQGWNHFST